MTTKQVRTTVEVFEDHLRLRERHAVEEDIARNYAEDVVLLTLEGVFHGHDGVRHTSQTLHELLPGGHYDYLKKQVAGGSTPIWNGRAQHRMGRRRSSTAPMATSSATAASSPR